MIATENDGEEFDQIKGWKEKVKEEYTMVDGAVNVGSDVGESSGTMRKCFYPNYIDSPRKCCA